MMELFEFAVRCIVLLLCIYPIVDRICRCKESKYLDCALVEKYKCDNRKE